MAARQTSGCVVVGAILAALGAALVGLVSVRSCVDDRPALTAKDMPAAPESPRPRDPGIGETAYIWHVSGRPYPVFPARADLEAFVAADDPGKNLLALRARMAPNGARVAVVERSGGVARVRLLDGAAAGVEGYVFAPALRPALP